MYLCLFARQVRILNLPKISDICTYSFLAGKDRFLVLIPYEMYAFLFAFTCNAFYFVYFFEMYSCLFGRQLIDWCFVLCVLGALLQ